MERLAFLDWRLDRDWSGEGGIDLASRMLIDARRYFDEIPFEATYP